MKNDREKFEHNGFTVKWSGWFEPPNQLTYIGQWSAWKDPSDFRAVRTDEFGLPPFGASQDELDALKMLTMGELLEALDKYPSLEDQS